MSSIKYQIYIPEHMWGNLFKKIFPPEMTTIITKNFEVGDPNASKSTDLIIREALIEGSDIYNKSSKSTIPIFILPITVLPQYTVDLLTKKDVGFPKLKIIAPAFKTRDDIFIFLKHERNKIASEIEQIKIAGKGEDITTTTLCQYFKEEVLENVIDPLYNEKYGLKMWDYLVEVDGCEGEDRESGVADGTHKGLIAAGPELKKFWLDRSWISAINLNSWICNKYNVTYFVRAAFCSLDIINAENNKYLIDFWKLFCEHSSNWFKTIFENTGDVDGYYRNGKLSYPIQLPSVTMEGDQMQTEIAIDLWVMNEFLNSTVNKNGKKFFYENILITNKFILWEIARQKKKNDLWKMLMKYCVYPAYKRKDSSNILNHIEETKGKYLKEFLKTSFNYNMNDIDNFDAYLSDSLINCFKPDFKNIILDKETFKQNFNTIFNKANKNTWA